MLSLGIVGLPNVGKSTLFNALTRSKQADAQNYPFCTIDPNIGVVEVPDTRLGQLAQVSKSKKNIPAAIEFVDIAGLVKGAHKGEGLGNKFLQHIREVDAIIHVVRDFSDSDITHTQEAIDPEQDKEIINQELIVADWQIIQKRIETIEKKLKGKIDKQIQFEKKVLEKVNEQLEKEKMLRDINWLEEEIEIIKKLPLLTSKPMMYVINTSEDRVSKEEKLFEQEAPEIRICAKTEAETAQLSSDEALAYLREIGIAKTGLDKLIIEGYKLLELATFFTSDEPESRAWTIKRGTKAPDAAGVIHTDFIKGFIKADVIDWKDFIECNGWVGSKQSGKLRLEGKEYEIKDGEVVYFHVQT